MDDSIRSYIAGLFDGEGSCFAYKHNRSHEVRIQIGLTDRMLLESVRLDLGFGTIFHERRGHPRKDCYFLRFHRHEMKRKFIQVIRPYVRLKGPQLDLAIKILDQENPSHRKLSDVSLRIREEACVGLRELNRRGRHEVA